MRFSPWLIWSKMDGFLLERWSSHIYSLVMNFVISADFNKDTNVKCKCITHCDTFFPSSRVQSILLPNSSFISSKHHSIFYILLHCDCTIFSHSVFQYDIFLLSSYCTNVSFYLVLKAKRIPAHNHPVIERLLTYRNVSMLLFLYRIIYQQMCG